MEENANEQPRSRWKRFWKWQPSEATRRKWWWVMIKKTKIPGVKEAVQNDIHICERSDKYPFSLLHFI